MVYLEKGVYLEKVYLKKNPFLAAKNVLDPKCYKNLSTDKDSMDSHKSSATMDKHHDVPLPPLHGLPPCPPISFPFVSKHLTFSEFSKILNSRRNGSAPGINMIPYKVYKFCSSLRDFLFRLIVSCFKNCVVPIQWRIAVETYIPKVKDPDQSKIKDFRAISLLNVEGKLFFSVLSKRLEQHIFKNNLIDKSIQKGCMEKVPGCWEHMSVVWKELKSSKSEKNNVSAIWLDIANAYGSVPHQLIFFSLKRYGVPDCWISLFLKYYGGLWSISGSDSAPSSWHHHQKGIFAGCTVSIILFLSAINVVIEYISVATLEKAFDGMTSTPVKAFMDDMFLMSPSIPSTQILLDRCTAALQWARMSFRASKSRSIVISEGKVVNVSPFSCYSEIIPSIHSNPVKFLGRSIDFSLTDKDAVENFVSAVLTGLDLIDKSSHKGIHKVWILQNMFISRLRWPLLIYEISLSVVMRMEQKISSFIRKWLKIHQSTTNICLYSASSPCPLPLKSLTSILKSCKVSGHLLLRESADNKIDKSTSQLKCGFWDVSEAVVDAESKLEFQKIVGYHQTSRAGFGSFKQPTIPQKSSYEYRKLISEIVQEDNQSTYHAKAVQLHMQGYWTQWCSFVKNDLSWKTLLAMPSPLISFCLEATYNTLPCPSNLKRWKLSTEASCFLCDKSVCTSAHVLGACSVALSEGRFTFRHDSVLREIIMAIKDFLSTYKPVKASPQGFIKFVKQGIKPVKSSKKVHTGILHSASDWKLRFDYGDDKLVVPSFLTITTLRPDILLFSAITKKVVIIELTCPCEENMSQWHLDKTEKYHSLCSSIRSNGWAVYFFSVEVGARGFCADSVKNCLFSLGFNSKNRKKILKTLSSTSLKCSFEIWLSRNSKGWSHELPKMPPTPKSKKDKLTDLQCSPKSRHSKVPSKSSGGSSYKVSSSFPLASISEERVSPSPVPKVTSSKVSSSLASAVLSAGCFSPGVKAKQKRPGIINKGNTCYVSAILQCLSVLPDLWPSNPPKNSSFILSLNKMLHHLHSCKSHLDPSPFLKSLENVLIKAGKGPIDIFSQQDVVEILEVVLQEIAESSLLGNEVFNIKSLTRITCHNCVQENLIEDNTSMLQLPVLKDFQTSLRKIMGIESLVGDSAPFCYVCSQNCDSDSKISFASFGKYLIVQLRRFRFVEGVSSRDSSPFLCSSCVEVFLEVDGEVSVRKSFNLIAVINHSGTLNAGHYTCSIYDQEAWWHCNDKAVDKSQELSLNGSLPYVLFYEAM